VTPPAWSPYPDVPEHPPSRRLLVDGEVFGVRRDADGSVHLDWISGPNPAYGFTMSGDADVAPSDSELACAIRQFLANVNPSTGYLD
jgi:hypothetical protein